MLVLEALDVVHAHQVVGVDVTAGRHVEHHAGGEQLLGRNLVDGGRSRSKWLGASRCVPRCSGEEKALDSTPSFSRVAIVCSSNGL